MVIKIFSFKFLYFVQLVFNECFGGSYSIINQGWNWFFKQITFAGLWKGKFFPFFSSKRNAKGFLKNEYFLGFGLRGRKFSQNPISYTTRRFFLFKTEKPPTFFYFKKGKGNLRCHFYSFYIRNLIFYLTKNIFCQKKFFFTPQKKKSTIF